MNIRAKQIQSIDSQNKMDITTALSFFAQMMTKVAADTTLTTAMGSVWTTYTAAYDAFDDAYAQTRKWAQTADLETLDKQRDTALSAYLNALKAMLASPNAAKQQAAKLLQFIRDKYTLSAGDEYMKETTAISQMIQEIEADAQATAALATTGLDDWLLDLKTKNASFLAKMNERTEAQAGQQKGIVRETRLACEAAYRDVVKLINAMAICEVPAGYSFGSIIDLLNAEIEHYRQILARKGGSSSGGGSNSSNNNGGGGSNNNNNGGGSDDNNGGGSDDNNGGGSGDNGGGSDDNNGGGSDDNNGGGSGDNGSGDDNNGGGSDDNNGGSGDNGGDTPGGGGDPTDYN